jgi:hypothetical protein
MELVITKLMGVTQLLESAKAVAAQQQERGALQVTLGDHLGRLLDERHITYSHLTFEPAPSLQRITVHFDGLKAASTEAVGQWHPITGDITLDFHPPNQWHYSGSGDLSALSGIISTATPGFPWPSPTTRASAASLNSAEFHYRVFEADAALVDKLIPPASRFTISAPSDEFTISLGGVAYADAQAAQISHETLDSLLAGLPEKPALIAGQSREVGSDTTGRRPASGTIGVLEDQTREVGSEWWHPGMADGWSYSSSDLNGLTGSGNGMGFLGFRHVHGTDEVRIAYHVDHSLDLSGHDSVNLHSKLFYQGTIPASRTLAFLVPFSRSDRSKHYLVTVFEIGNSTEQAVPVATTQNLSYGPVMERNLPFEQATIGMQYINFKSGKVFSPSPDADAHDKKAFQNWLDQRKPDALADDLTFGPTLSSYETDCGYLAVPADGWDTIKAADIANDLASAHLEQTATPQDTNALPAIFLFKTRDGTEGILQIIGYASNPHGVNFRYKLVQNAAASPAPTPSSQVEAEVKFFEVPSGLPLDLNHFDLAAVANQHGVTLLSAPRVTVSSGRECEIDVVNGATKDPFAPTPTGVSARLRPTLDGETVHYAAKFTISTRPTPDDAHTDIREFTHAGDAPLGKPEVFEVGTGEKGNHLLAWMVFHKVESTPP